MADFDFIRHSLAHSNVEFIDRRNVRFTSKDNPEEKLDVSLSYFYEYPSLMYVKTWTASFLYECMRQSLLINNLRFMK